MADSLSLKDGETWLWSLLRARHRLCRLRRSSQRNGKRCGAFDNPVQHSRLIHAKGKIVPHGGARKGAGRPSASGRYGEETVAIRVPVSLLSEVSARLSEHLSARQSERAATPKPVTFLALNEPASDAPEVHGPVEAIDFLARLRASKIEADCTILDPWYGEQSSASRSQFLAELLPLIYAAAAVSKHVFVWGWPASLARLVDHLPTGWALESWLTWAFKNAPDRGKGWRPTQQACLHLRRADAPMFPQHFYSPRHAELASQNRLEFKPNPYSVIDYPLLSGFIGKAEQMGFSGQKPEAVIRPLILMSTEPGGLVIDPTSGTGTTGVVAVKLGRRVMLADRSARSLRLTRRRLVALVK